MKERIEKLQSLIDLFDRNIKQYKSNSYDESNTRIDFIDKFFELFDWDVRNTKESSEQYREVVREDKVIIKGKPKAPDYSFRVGRGQILFFVEAKKPSVNIKEDIHPAFQIRRYAYSAKLPLSILTDFEEFAVYDTRIKPNPNDNAGVGRVFYCTYKEYIDNFDFIYNTFSKPAVYKGSFDRYIEENKNKKGTSEVDKEFLKLIETWRNELAKNIALRNKDLDVYNLNYAIQKIIDRIIFLRIAEDRHMEEYDNLRKICDSAVIYSTLDKYFQKANDKYNSGLFKVEEWLSKLEIDNKILSNIIKGLYYPDCPYEFSVLPIETLGNIYEQFLGKTIRLTQSHQAKVEDKPEVRKAGGVYYTPQYIVDYIVGNTVGEKIKNKTPKQIEKLTILDPACGSGSFLVRAFKYLLDYHNDWHTKKENIKKALKDENIYQVGENDYRLTIEEKQKILLNNIYGVDIDSQAVEVTKLSLLLKLLEGEGVQAQFDLFKHSDIKLLPDISNNIKCGNSLIGTDYYKDKNLSLFGTEEMRKVNAFDWNKEFPSIFQNNHSNFLPSHSDSPPGHSRENGNPSHSSSLPSHSRPDRESSGFDVVIGNPPYGALFSDNEKQYLQNNFQSYEYQINSFTLFIEKGTSLLNSKGDIAYITPAVFLNQHYFMNIRSLIIKNYFIQKILLLNYKVFEDADTGDTCIFVISNQKTVKLKYSMLKHLNDFNILKYKQKSQKEFSNNQRFEFNISLNSNVIEKINNISFPLQEIANCIMGIKPYQKGKGIPKQNENIVKRRIFDSKNKKDKSYKQYLIGKDIDRYIINPLESRYIKYGKWLAEPRLTAPFERTKIILRQTSDKIKAIIDNNRYYNLNNIYNIEITNTNYHYNYILGILNSTLMIYIYQNIVPEKGKLFAEIKKVNLVKLPIKKVISENDKQVSNNLENLVNQMLETQKQFHSAKTDNDKKNYQKKIEIIDQQIDDLVYKLYNLTEEEIKIIESDN